jgi:hypothetical protein
MYVDCQMQYDLKLETWYKEHLDLFQDQVRPWTASQHSGSISEPVVQSISLNFFINFVDNGKLSIKNSEQDHGALDARATCHSDEYKTSHLVKTLSHRDNQQQSYRQVGSNQARCYPSRPRLPSTYIYISFTLSNFTICPNSLPPPSISSDAYLYLLLGGL